MFRGTQKEVLAAASQPGLFHFYAFTSTFDLLIGIIRFADDPNGESVKRIPMSSTSVISPLKTNCVGSGLSAPRMIPCWELLKRASPAASQPGLFHF